MKILIVTPYYAPAWAYGGPPKVLATLARELVKRGHSVSVITTDALNERRSSALVEMIDGVKIYRFRTISNTLAYKQKIFYVPRILRKTKTIITRADVVLFSDVRSILNWQLFGFTKKEGIPYGIFAFGQIPHSDDRKAVIKKLFDLYWVNRFVRGASWCFAQTEHERDMFTEHFHVSKKVTQLMVLPIDVPKQTDHRSGIAYFSDFGIQPTDKLILFVGRFHILKGADILVKTVLPLLRADKSLKLILIGRDDGAERNLRRMVPTDLKTSILFPGPIYGNLIAGWYMRAACFVFTPRYYEETSTAALEALSYGCPVVTTRQSDIPFLSVYNAGIIANGVLAIRKAIHTILKNRGNMKKNAIQLIRNVYRSDRVADTLVSCIRK